MQGAFRGAMAGGAAWVATALILSWAGVGADHWFVALIVGAVGGVEMWRWERLRAERGGSVAEAACGRAGESAWRPGAIAVDDDRT